MENPIQPQRTFLQKIFISPTEPRLRAGWRLLIQTIMMLVLALIFGILYGILTQLIPGLSPNNMFANQVIELFFITGSVFLARWLLDRRSIASLGLRLDKFVLSDLLAGIGITFVMMGAIYLIGLAAGWIEFEGFAWQFDSPSTVFIQTLFGLFIFLLVGWSEELLSRGYHLQTLASGMNLFWGVLISSSVFGLLHLGNPNADAPLMVSLGIFLAGLFLAYGYLRTGQLWLPIGLHIGWNFFEGVVFGFPVSGLDTYRLLHITVSGPSLWTGGKFGPESGLIVIAGLVIGTILIYIYTRGREKVQKVQ